MKQNLLLFLFFSFIVNISFANSIKVNGIYYNVNQANNTAEVAKSVEGYSGDIVIPYSFVYDGITYTVTSIAGVSDGASDYEGSPAFGECSQLYSITIPPSIRNIRTNAFAGCNNLRAVYISDLEAWCKIGFSFYWGKFSSTTNPLSIAHSLYLNGEKITNLTIPENITKVPCSTFAGGDFSTVTFHKNVKEIGAFAFVYCNNLTDIYSYSEKIGLWDLSNYSTFSSEEKATLHVRERFKDNYTKPDWPSFGKVEFIEGVDYHLIYKVDGEEYKNNWQEVGDSITIEAEPTKEGYSFSGWSDIPETMPAHDVIVKGSFAINKYKLTYVVDGQEYKSYDIEYNSLLTPEEKPTKKGMTFIGWSEIPEKMPAHDITVMGSFSWSKLTKHNVVYEVTDTLDNCCRVIGGDNASGEIEIDSVEIDHCYYRPTEIVDKAFYKCKDITCIEIPKTVAAISERAFANIDKLSDVTILAEDVPTTDRTAFENSYIEDYVTLHVPYGALEKYKATLPWSAFNKIIAINGTEPFEKCCEPTIEYKDGRLIVNCDMEDAECVTTITSDDFGEHQGREIEVCATYIINTYAKADGYANSDYVTATLCWIEVEGVATFVNGTVEANAVLIQNQGGVLLISGYIAGMDIEVYNMEGQMVGSEKGVNGMTRVNSKLKAGDVAIVKIRNKTIKFLLR